MINAARILYGEEFGEVCGATLSTEMVSRYASVARRVPAQNRRPSLSWSAHAAVARLPHAQQRRLLIEAERKVGTATSCARKCNSSSKPIESNPSPFRPPPPPSAQCSTPPTRSC